MSPRKNNYISKLMGFSLLEVMIGLTLSAFILTGLVKIFSVTYKNYLFQVDLTTMQNNSRIANKILSSEIHYADYLGCASLSNEFPLINHTEYSINPRKIISGYIGDKVKPNTEGFTVIHADPVHAELIHQAQIGTEIIVTGSPIFVAGDTLVISDCKHVEIFQVKTSYMTKDGLQKITSLSSFSYKYDANAEVSHFLKNSFFIAETKRNNKNSPKKYGLFYENIHKNKTELIENITNMKIKFLVNEGRYLNEKSIEQISEFSEIIGVSIELEMMSENSVLFSKKIPIFSAVRKFQ